MIVSVMVQMQEGDEPFGLVPDEVAAAVLTAVGGDPSSSSCSVTINPVLTTRRGTAGAPVEPAPA